MRLSIRLGRCWSDRHRINIVSTKKETRDFLTLADFMPGGAGAAPKTTPASPNQTHSAANTEAVIASAGSALESGHELASEESLIAALKTIQDPELGINVYDLGLIYSIERNTERGEITLSMTLTTPACPVAGSFIQTVAHTLASMPDTGKVFIRLVWSPPWTPERMSDEARLALDL